jgi:hypothetical protein
VHGGELMRRVRPSYPNPKTILGSACVLWLRADRFDVATGVSRIYDRAKGTAQDAVQATAGAQPLGYGRSTSNGKFYTKGDTSNDYLLAPLSTTISAGARPYVWLVCKRGTAGVGFALNNSVDAQNVLYFVMSATPYAGLTSSETSSTEGLDWLAPDTGVHLHEAGFLAQVVGRYRVDGVPCLIGVHVGTSFRQANRVFIGAFTAGGSPTSFNDAEIYESVVADSLPNADQLSQMRDYFAREYGLTITRSTLLLDNVTVAARAALSCYRRLRMAYTGPALLARRADNVELAFGFTSAGILDTAALLSWAAGQSVYLKTIYDQSGNARDFTQATTTKQPRLVNAGVLDVNPNGRVAPLFDGSNDTLLRPDALGFSGSQNIAAGWACALANAATTYSTAWMLGGTGFAGDGVSVGSNMSNTQSNFARGGPHYRTFTVADQRNPHYYVAQWAAGAGVAAMDLRQDGAAVSGSTTGSSGVSYVNTQTSFGSAQDGVGGGWIQGWMNCLIVFNALLGAADLAALESELAAHG